MNTELGKISQVKFGYGGYQDMQFGLSLTFESKGWGVSTFIGSSWSIDMEVSEHSQWTEEDRDKGFARTMRKLNEYMKDAKVKDVYQLKGIPVEVTFDCNELDSWRILTEVL